MGAVCAVEGVDETTEFDEDEFDDTTRRAELFCGVVSIGVAHACAVTREGRVVTWGATDHSALGHKAQGGGADVLCPTEVTAAHYSLTSPLCDPLQFEHPPGPLPVNASTHCPGRWNHFEACGWWPRPVVLPTRRGSPRAGTSGSVVSAPSPLARDSPFVSLKFGSRESRRCVAVTCCACSGGLLSTVPVQLQLGGVHTHPPHLPWRLLQGANPAVEWERNLWCMWQQARITPGW
jgi:hypothetical protein